MFLTLRGKVRKGDKGMVARATNPNANENTKIVDEDAEQRAQEFFEGVMHFGKKLILHLSTKESDRLIRKENIQLDREHIMAEAWGKPLLKLQGKLKGTPWDPEPSHDIPFSKFWKLLEKKRVRYMEYGDLGQSVAGEQWC
eukprot:Gb_02529 [translate_table: standard]